MPGSSQPRNTLRAQLELDLSISDENLQNRRRRLFASSTILDGRLHFFFNSANSFRSDVNEFDSNADPCKAIPDFAASLYHHVGPAQPESEIHYGTLMEVDGSVHEHPARADVGRV